MNAVLTSLELDKENLAAKSICFIGDNLCDSNFIVSSFIWNAVRSDDSGLILVSFHRSFDHYNLVGVKSGFNLNSCLEKGSFVHVDVAKYIYHKISSCNLSNLLDGDFAPELLHSIESSVEQLASKYGNVHLIVDCISDILNGGAQLKTVLKFACHLRFLLDRYQKTILVIGSQCCQDDGDKISLRNFLLNSCDYRIIVSPLKTGFSTQVSGSIRYSKRDTSAIKMWSNEQLHHFKITDRNIKLFAPGSLV